MKTPALSTVYVDGVRIGLMGDPRPLVAKAVAAAGRTLDVRVVRKRTLDDGGVTVHLDDFIDRTADPAKPIYLVCTPNLRPTAADGTTPADMPKALRAAPTPRATLPVAGSPKGRMSSPDDVGNDAPPEWRP